jgi:hypothetical protein
VDTNTRAALAVLIFLDFTLLTYFKNTESAVFSSRFYTTDAKFSLYLINRYTVARDFLPFSEWDSVVNKGRADMAGDHKFR